MCMRFAGGHVDARGVVVRHQPPARAARNAINSRAHGLPHFLTLVKSCRTGHWRRAHASPRRHRIAPTWCLTRSGSSKTLSPTHRCAFPSTPMRRLVRTRVMLHWHFADRLPRWTGYTTLSLLRPLCRARTGRTFVFTPGFFQQYISLHYQICEMLEKLGAKHVLLCGHSLGGALATIAVAMLPNKYTCDLATFGSPRAGNALFAEVVRARCVSVARVVHDRDVVTTAPLRLMGYEHVVGDWMLLLLPDASITIMEKPRSLVQELWLRACGVFSADFGISDHFITAYLAGLPEPQQFETVTQQPKPEVVESATSTDPETEPETEPETGTGTSRRQTKMKRLQRRNRSPQVKEKHHRRRPRRRRRARMHLRRKRHRQTKNLRHRRSRSRSRSKRTKNLRHRRKTSRSRSRSKRTKNLRHRRKTSRSRSRSKRTKDLRHRRKTSRSRSRSKRTKDLRHRRKTSRSRSRSMMLAQETSKVASPLKHRKTHPLPRRSDLTLVLQSCAAS